MTEAVRAAHAAQRSTRPRGATAYSAACATRTDMPHWEYRTQIGKIRTQLLHSRKNGKKLEGGGAEDDDEDGRKDTEQRREENLDGGFLSHFLSALLSL